MYPQTCKTCRGMLRIMWCPCAWKTTSIIEVMTLKCLSRFMSRKRKDVATWPIKRRCGISSCHSPTSQKWPRSIERFSHLQEIGIGPCMTVNVLLHILVDEEEGRRHMHACWFVQSAFGAWDGRGPAKINSKNNTFSLSLKCFVHSAFTACEGRVLSKI